MNVLDLHTVADWLSDAADTVACCQNIFTEEQQKGLGSSMQTLVEDYRRNAERVRAMALETTPAYFSD